jgi:hypothetical protein
MELILSENVDKKAWDALVSRSGGTVFSLVHYLDGTADNWAVLWNSDRSGGMVCPFAVKLGVKVLYAPFFHRYTEWIGDNCPDPAQLRAELQRYFPVADAQWKEEMPGMLERVHQVLNREDFQPNQQAKRMLKKGAHYEVRLERRDQELMRLLHRELRPRVASIDGHSLSLLEKLVSGFNEQELIQLNLLENEAWKGAIWLLPFNGRMLYLKGTVEPDAKNNGGMYRLMECAIQLAFERAMLFDFGGSNAEGVRRFNLNWGGKDVSYRALQWNNAPLWWKIVKSLRQTWNNTSSS